MGFKVLTTGGAIKQGVITTLDLANATGTLAVENGGSERTSATAYAVITGGTTSTSAHQSVASVGTSGQILTSGGAGVLPAFATPASQSDWTTTVTKSANQDVTDSSTLFADTELKIAVVSGEVWFIEMMLLYGSNSAAGDYKFNFTYPSAFGWHRWLGFNNISGTINSNTGVRDSGTTTHAADYTANTAALAKDVFLIQMFCRFDASGDFQFVFAQNVATSATFARTTQGSILRGKKII